MDQYFINTITKENYDIEHLPTFMDKNTDFENLQSYAIYHF